MKKSSPNFDFINVSNSFLKHLKISLLLVVLITSAKINAQGTTCSNATNISINGSCLSSNSGSLTGNDSSPNFLTCQNNGNVNNVRWYTFTVTGGPLNVTVTAIGNRNLAFQLIGSTTNNCSNLSEIACVNNNPGQGNNDIDETTTNLLANGTYFIKILNNANNNNLDLTSLCVTGVAPQNIVPTTGSNSYTLCSGNLYDNGGSAGNYVNNSNGYTIINPSISGNRIRVSGTLIAEGGYDYMTIYDGAGTGGTVLWGGAPHSTGTACTTITIPTITSTTGPLTVRFQSDFSNFCAGFNIAISCIATPQITSLSSPSGCVGSSLTITGTNLSSASSVTIGGTAATITANSATSITVTVGTGTTGNVLVTTPSGISNPLPFSILVTPNITSQPTTPTTVCAGTGTRTISVNATNASTYQWRRNGVNIANGAPYNGVTTATLTITNPALAIAGNFDVVISNGSCSRTSNAVALTVTSTPSITANPTNSIVAAGANTSFTVVASNNPTSYVWQVSTNGGGAWSTITNGGVYSNATTASLNITNATAGMNGYLYRVSATNSCGTSAYSTNALLTVTLNYCIPTSENTNRVYIDKIDFVGTLNDISNSSTFSTNGYQDFTNLTNRAIQAQGEGVNIILNNVNTGNTTTGGRVKAWIDWNRDGIFSQNALEEIYNPGPYAGTNLTFGFIIPPTAQPGLYRIRFRVYNNINNSFGYDFNPCESFTGNNYSDVEDYLFQVIPSCSANIVSVTDGNNCGSGPVTISATGTSNTIAYRWYTSETSTTAISGETGSSYTTPSLTSSTTYYVTAISSSCESVVKTPVNANINPTPTINITPQNPVICGENAVISIVAGGDKETVTLVNENFENNTLGAFDNKNNDSNNSSVDAKTAWQIKSSSFIPTGGIVWYPAISSGIGSNKFALATSDINPIAGSTIENALNLISSVNTTGFINLTLKLRMFYSRELANNDIQLDEYVRIQVSTDNGVNWTNITTLLTDIGLGTRFASLEYNLNSYINSPNLRVRIIHRAYSSSSMWLAGGVAVDDIKLYGEKTLTTSFNYNTSVVDAFQDFACTLPYMSGAPATTIYIRPTVTQLENANFIIPVSTTLSNGCIVNGDINVTNNTKLYTPNAANSDWNTPSNWKPNGVPTASNCVVVFKDVNITGPNNTEKGLNLIVKAGKKLNIAPNNSLIITDFINVEPTGVFQIENNSNLVQINDVINTGNIIYKRTAPNIKGSDYVYWSSPVNNQALNSIYSSPAQGPKYSWNTLANNGNGTGGNISQGNYVNANGVTMGTGVGYIVRGSSSFGMGATNINSAFTGRPNNGTINVPVSRGVYQGLQYTGANGAPITNLDDNYNLIGNPYPSAINALKFISDNSSVIRGNVQLWKHGSDPAANNGTTYTNPFYGTYAYNYSASDYITINNSGTSTPGFSENIKAGQAFFVEMLDGPTTSQTVNFNNSQRRDDSGIPYKNDAFYKNANQQNANYENLERHRIWLDIKDVNNISEVALVGYIEGATMGDDSSYDAFATTLNMGIYSFINNQPYIIQGRSLPFDDDDQVSIGFNVPSAGNYSIGINTADGLFLGTQDIYLKDELLNIYHDLKTNPYSFTATAGIHNDRFKLVYKNNVLSTETFNQNKIQIVKNNTVVEIVSGNEVIDNVKIYDVRGRLLVEKTKINNNFITIDLNATQDQVLIINIVTLDGIKIIRKIL